MAIPDDRVRRLHASLREERRELGRRLQHVVRTGDLGKGNVLRARDVSWTLPVWPHAAALDAVVEAGIAAVDDRGARLADVRAHIVVCNDDGTSLERRETSFTLGRHFVRERTTFAHPRRGPAIEEYRVGAKAGVIEREEHARRRREPSARHRDDDARLIGYSQPRQTSAER